MNRSHYPLYALAAAVALGAIWAGIPASTVLFAAVLLACPLMMAFMHGGHGGAHGDHNVRAPSRIEHQHHAAGGGEEPGSQDDVVRR